MKKKSKSKAKKKYLQKSVSTLKKLADKYFSIYIRQREMENGYNKCFTCGIVKLWKELQCGHYVSRMYINLRYDEKNCHPQCMACNVFKKGNLDTYAIKLMDKYGEGILRELDNEKYNYRKWGVMDYSLIISKYK